MTGPVDPDRDQLACCSRMALVREQLALGGFTQADLARHLGISQKHLSQLLTGKVAGSVEMWDRIAEAIGYRWELVPR